MQQRVPPLLQQAVPAGHWHGARLDQRLFAVSCPALGCDLQLTAKLDDIRSDASDIATLALLQRAKARPQYQWHLCDSSSGENGRHLPWLDLSLATVVGGGADHGDDCWLVLDFRYNQEDPAVVFNAEVAGTQGHQAKWHLLTPSLSVFISTIQVGLTEPRGDA